MVVAPPDQEADQLSALLLFETLQRRYVMNSTYFDEETVES
jgi:hypothetical protein